MSEPVQVKGTTFISTMRFIEEKHGAAALAEVLQALPEADRSLIQAGITDRRFYPFRVLVQLMQTSKRLHNGPPDYYQQMGRASADYAMSVFLKALFKVASPEFLINQAAVFYGSFYTSGRIKITGATKGGCSMHLEKFAEPCPEFCDRVQGWAIRILELSGGKNIVSNKVACVCKGDPVCRYDATWTT